MSVEAFDFETFFNSCKRNNTETTAIEKTAKQIECQALQVFSVPGQRDIEGYCKVDEFAHKVCPYSELEHIWLFQRAPSSAPILHTPSSQHSNQPLTDMVATTPQLTTVLPSPSSSPVPPTKSDRRQLKAKKGNAHYDLIVVEVYEISNISSALYNSKEKSE
ncbi:unnamed protein product, partial [Ceratitis capitata]